MRTLILTILLLALAVCAHAADVTLQWDANTEADLAGYRVYQGSGSNPTTFTRVQQVAATTAKIKGLDNSSHSFVVTAYNTAAQAQTLAGKFSTLEDAASGMGRTVGKAMTPAFEEAIEAAGGLIKVVAGSNSAFDRTVDYIKAAAAALTTYQIVTNATEIKTIALSAASRARDAEIDAEGEANA